MSLTYEPDTTSTPEARYRPTHAVLEAERAVVGLALYNNALADAAAAALTATDFYDTTHGVIFQACCDLTGSGQPVSTTTVYRHLTTTSQLHPITQRAGNPLAYLNDLVDGVVVPHPGHLAYHAQTVSDDAYRRNLHTEAVRVAQATADPGFDQDVAAAVIERFTQVAARRPADDQPEKLYVQDRIPDFLDTLENDGPDATLVTSPWRALNDGVHARTGQLIVAAARPGCGKSLLGLNWGAHRAIRHGEQALVASLEMGGDELMRRLIASEARIPLHHLETRELTDLDWDKIRKVLPKLETCRLLLDSPGSMTLPHLRSRLTWMKTQGPVRLAVVDYLQLLTATARAERRDLEVGAFTRGLKQMAGELDVCILALSQLNRGPEQRTDKKPVMSDLRESGSIENDANTVMLLHRPDRDEPEHPRAGEVDVIVAKQRAGATFETPLAWQGHYGRLTDLGRGVQEWETI